ncbi:MAG: M23 family metallopeptidase [Candidatus Dojkabacteria bacterium]
MSRLFWGRDSLYKTIVHSAMIGATAIVFVGGIVTRVESNNAPSVLGISTNDDVLSAGGNIQALESTDTGNRVKSYTVKEGDTLENVAKKFNLKMETVRWANIKEIGPFTNNIQVGWELKIPYTDGVLYSVKAGDTVYKVAKELSSDVFAISEINNLKEPDYKLTVGEDIMIPDGRLSVQDLGNIVTVTEDNLVGAFIDPLSNPACNGYHYYGGINSYPGHNGVDVGIAGGCPEQAIAAGMVYFSGWEDISGYTVKIDHGGGVHSYYYHGDGEIWVKAGQYVEQGTDLQMMGCTGNCFGTHLHITIKLNGNTIAPEAYIPFKFNQ